MIAIVSSSLPTSLTVHARNTASRAVRREPDGVGASAVRPRDAPGLSRREERRARGRRPPAESQAPSPLVLACRTPPPRGPKAARARHAGLVARAPSSEDSEGEGEEKRIRVIVRKRPTSRSESAAAERGEETDVVHDCRRLPLRDRDRLLEAPRPAQQEESRQMPRGQQGQGSLPPGLSKHPVHDAGRLMEIIDKGSQNRSTRTMSANSWSHTVLQLSLRRGDGGRVRNREAGRLSFTDLAGSSGGRHIPGLPNHEHGGRRDQHVAPRAQGGHPRPRHR